jgi:hypothetical protein
MNQQHVNVIFTTGLPQLRIITLKLGKRKLRPTTTSVHYGSTTGTSKTMGVILGRRISVRTLDWELGVGHDGPEPILPEVVIEAVPIRADGRVAGRWSRRDRLWFGQDALSRYATVENHSIDLVADVGDLLLKPNDLVDVTPQVFDRVN